MAEPNNIQSALDFATQRAKVDLVQVDHPSDDRKAVLAAVPSGQQLHSLKKFFDENLPTPERSKGTSSHLNAGSFIQHVLRHKSENSVIFASGDTANPSFTAIYNYNQSGQKNPQFGDYRSVFSCKLSKEWEKWNEQNGETLDQLEFAEFIEDRIEDIIDAPDLNDPKNAALKELAITLGYQFGNKLKIMELSRGISINEANKAKAICSLATGQGVIEYSSEHNDAEGKRLVIPGLFMIGIPVFREGLLYRVPVKLRYRINSGKVTWAYILNRQEKFFDDAYNDLSAQIAKETGLPIFVGAPE